jgi:small conductance mechanosensitive channel
MQDFVNAVLQWLVTSGPKILGAILVLIVGRIVAGILKSLVRKLLTGRKMDPSVVGFLSSLTYALVIVFAFVAAFAKFGVETASFVAVLGAASFAVGFALQGSLGNFASGVMLLTFRPFKVGDYIDAAGVAGTVREIRLFSTVLATPDNVQIIIPNGAVYGSTIKNYSAYDTRRVDLLIGIGYGSSIQTAYEVLEGLIKADSRILSDPAHQIAVSELADSSVNLVVRSWVKKEDYWAVKFDLTEKIKKTFDERGVEIPFPQRTIHLLQAAGE